MQALVYTLRMTKGQIEAVISTALTQFEREVLGRGPRVTRTYILHDMVIVRLHGVLTPGEKQLAKEPGGVALIKELRTRLVESFQTDLRHIVEHHTGHAVLSMHTDISTLTGERLLVFEMAADLEHLTSQDATPSH